MASYGRLHDGCGCRSSLVFCSSDLQQLSSLALRWYSRNLKLHGLPPVVRTSSLPFSQPMSFSPLLGFEVPREKRCLEFTSPSWKFHRPTERWVCFAGGGKRPRRPRIWKSRHRRGSFNKSDKLLESLEAVSNVKEEVYGVLDRFVAWELDFPLIAVKKALHILENEKNWPRIIQIVKWMLGKGQGRTLNTYFLLLKAFSQEGRTDEAQEIFQKVFAKNLECTPIKLFSEIMRMYERHEMYEDILEVFADMEELDVRLDTVISGIVTRTYEKIGDMDRALRVRSKYGAPKFRWRMINGHTVKLRNVDKDVTVSRWTKDHNLDHQVKNESCTGDDDSDYLRMDNDTDTHDHYYIGNNQDGMVAEEDVRDNESADDEELEIEEDEEDQLDEDDLANEVYFRHFRARQTFENEVYV